MDNSLLTVVLVFLLFAVALNLLLTLRLASVVHRVLQQDDLPFALPAGTVVPEFDGRRLADGARISLQHLAGHSTVMVFISAACKKCNGRIPELTQIEAAMRRAGVDLLIVEMDSERRIVELLKDSPLFEHVIMLSTKMLRRLNPMTSAPFYIFIDEQQQVRASNLVGDEDWEAFVEQMREAGEA